MNEPLMHNSIKLSLSTALGGGAGIGGGYYLTQHDKNAEVKKLQDELEDYKTRAPFLERLNKEGRDWALQMKIDGKWCVLLYYNKTTETQIEKCDSADYKNIDSQLALIDQHE